MTLIKVIIKTAQNKKTRIHTHKEKPPTICCCQWTPACGAPTEANLSLLQAIDRTDGQTGDHYRDSALRMLCGQCQKFLLAMS